MSRQTLDQKPFRIDRATFLPAGTGSQKLHQLKVPLRYTGSSGDSVFDFVTTVGGSSVQASFSIGEDDDWVSVVGKIQSAKVTSPRKRDEKGAIVLDLVLLKDDLRMIRELLDFCLEASRVEALEVEVKFEIVQQDLAFEEEEGADG